MIALPDKEFHDELEKRFGLHLGDLKVVGPRKAFPLGLFTASSDGISTGRDGVVVAEDADTHKWQGSGLVAVADEDEWLDFITSPRRTGARALRYRLTTWDSRGDREA